MTVQADLDLIRSLIRRLVEPGGKFIDGGRWLTSADAEAALSRLELLLQEQEKGSEFNPTDTRNSLRDEKFLLDLLSWVPGWTVMKRSEVDRILNECEALRIERDDARAALSAREDRMSEELLSKIEAIISHGDLVLVQETHHGLECCIALRARLAALENVAPRAQASPDRTTEETGT